MSTPSKNTLSLIGAFLLVGAGAFLAGRNTGPGVSSPPPVVAGKPEEEEGGHGPHAEVGLIMFSAEALSAAGVRVEPVTARAVASRLALTGTVEPDPGGVVRITPRVGGKVTAVSVNVGDTVVAGQVLAQVASTQLAEAQAAYRQAGARLVTARGQLRRQRQLAGLGQFGRPAVEQARAEAIRAQGEVTAAQNDIATARNEVAEARSERVSFEGDAAGTEAEIATAQSEIAEAEQQVRALQTAVTQAGTGAKVAQSRFNRLDQLLKEELVSRQDWEQAQADAQRAAAEVDSARANLAQGQAKVETARAHLRAAQAKARASVARKEQAAAKIQTVQTRVAQVESRLEAARKRAEIAAQALAREEQVFRGGFLTSKEIVEAEAAVRQAEQEQRAAVDTIRLLGGVPGGGNVVAVTAPLGGRVTERAVTLGETVTPEKSLYTVTGMGTVWVQLAVSQGDLPAVKIGQPVSITSDSAPDHPFNGVVSSIGDLVDETTRTVRVRAVIQNMGGRLKPQTFVRATLRTGGSVKALAVPVDAVQTYEGKPVVFVAAEHAGEFLPKEVETGATEGGLTVITSGIAPGDRVVTRGAFTVKAQAMKSELGEE